ncbi:GyrI-like domain-containing protein [Dankookia sp. GCM10030260]|uniref:GyrI-like domain-containing protein n=1 Tax=Dankookia sp. GCM10030260 TaxID=3273390 RepID=UPI00361A6CA5
MMHQVSLRDDPGFRLAAIRHVGPYAGMAGAFDRIGAQAGSCGPIGPGTRFLAITHDDPRSIPAAALRTDAGCTVPAGAEAAG